MNLTSRQIRLFETQGRIFETAARRGLDCDAFVEAFMTGEVGRHFDMPVSRYHWAGEAYVLEEMDDLAGGLPTSDLVYHPDAMFWMGYTYRYWAIYKNVSSAEIYRHADAKKMALVYPGYHTLDCEMAIDRLLEAETDRLKQT